MTASYDKYYQTENLFGEPYPELLEFFASLSDKGKLLDLGCGQGRDAIPLARLGFEVVGIDSSEVGIVQMNAVAEQEKLKVTGMVADIFGYDDFGGYDFILLDSMFHFAKKDKEKEVGLVKKIVSRIHPGTLLVVCIQDSKGKVSTLNDSIDFEGKLDRIATQNFTYFFEDQETGHHSETPYLMLAVKK